MDGKTYEDLCKFPDNAKQEAGYQLHLVQSGDEPTDWKPMKTIGQGTKEIRINEDGAYRIIYVAKFEDAIYVLHAFPKKTQKTSKKDIDLARERYKTMQRKQVKNEYHYTQNHRQYF